MTMPAPPPYGVSSTVRCRSCVCSRRSCVRTSISPDCRALPSSDRSSTSKNDGKIVTMSIRMGPTLLGGVVGAVGCRGVAVGGSFGVSLGAAGPGFGRLRRLGRLGLLGELLEQPGGRRHGE